MTIYGQLEKAVLPLLRGYREDLTTHDKKAIGNRGGVPFVHYGRDNGTHIVFLGDSSTYPAEGVHVPYLFSSADRWHILKECTVLADHFTSEYNPPAKIVHYFDGRNLRRITVAQSVDIATAYQTRMRSLWRVENQKNAMGGE